MYYRDRENLCERLFLEGGPYFLVTTENLPWLLFSNDEDFKAGTNITAVALAFKNVTLLNDVQMNNHLHYVMEGKYENVLAFTDHLRKLMSRYQIKRGNPTLVKWNIQIKEITDLQNLRNAILYSERNPYVAGRDVSPYGYRWSSASLLFNDNIALLSPGIPFDSLTFREKREITMSRELMLPDSYRVLDGMILRQSFVNYKRAESFFESARQHFRMLSRYVESDAETAKWIGETILLPNEDVFRIVSGWYNVKTVSLLNPEQRLSAARRMKAELMSNNKQIAQVLKLPLEQVNLFFPVPQ